MKKTYIAPLTVEVKIEAMSVLATSLPIGNNDQTADTSDDATQLSNGFEGNQWEHSWED